VGAIKILYFDLETTGLSDKHGVTQLAGAIEVDGVIVEEFDFHMNIFPDDLINQKALDITNMTEEQIASFPDPIEVKNEFIKILDKHINKWDKNDKLIMCAYNGYTFDFGKIFNWMKKCGERWFGSYVNYSIKLDPIAVAHALSISGKLPIMNSYKLGKMCEYFDIKLDNAHDALADIRATIEVSKKLMELM